MTTTATFVKPAHHMTVKTAAKEGVDIRVSDNQTHYVLTHIDTDTVLLGRDAPQLLRDWVAFRMLRTEYSQIALKQDLKTFRWSALLKKKAVAEGACLEDVKDLALEALADSQQKSAKPAKVEKAPKAAKPAKKARKASGDEEDDEEAQSNEDNAESDVGDEAAAAAEDEEGDGEGKSIVKKKYKVAYHPFKDTNGDGLSGLIKAHVSTENDAGELRVDRKALKRFAVANDCWQPGYADLNSGQCKMNVTNRLRAKIRSGQKEGATPYVIIWG